MRNANPLNIIERRVSQVGPSADNASQSTLAPEGRETSRDLTAAYDQLMARHARTSFSFASRFLPSDKRESTIILYAFFRTMDDLVDTRDHTVDRDTVRDEVQSWKAWFRTPNDVPAPRESLARDIKRTIERHNIPIEPFDHFLRGLEFDLNECEVIDDHHLERYCYQVASTVGIVMSHTLGATQPDALGAAARLAAAMQLTNILRDIGEDLEAGRVYIPTRTLQSFGLTIDCLKTMMDGQGPNTAFRMLMANQIETARSWYEEGLVGIGQLPRESQFPILLASRLYRRLLDRIEARNYDTLRYRVSTSRSDKLREAAASYALIQLDRIDMRRPGTEWLGS